MVGMTSRILERLDALQPQAPDTPLAQSLLLGFDTETTGLSATKDAIVSASLVLRDPAVGFDGDVNDAWLINPHRHISAGAGAVNGFTDDFVISHGAEPVPTLDIIADAIGRAQELRIPIVAYNAPFDIHMLEGDLERWNLADLPSRSGGSGLLVADPLVIDRFVSHRKGHRTLTATTEYYGVRPHGSFHDAATDTVATLDLLGPMTRLFPEVGALRLDELMAWQSHAFASWKEGYNAWARDHGRRPRSDTWFDGVAGNGAEDAGTPGEATVQDAK